MPDSVLSEGAGGPASLAKSDRILQDLAQLSAREAVVDVEEAREKIVIFAYASDLYALPGRQVREILTVGEIWPVPGAPEFLPGLINIRGDIESVIDLRQLLGLAATAGRSSLVIVADTGAIRSGLLIDAMVDVVDVPVSAIEPPPSTLDDLRREFVVGVVSHEGRTIPLLNLDKAFARVLE